MFCIIDNSWINGSKTWSPYQIYRDIPDYKLNISASSQETKGIHQHDQSAFSVLNTAYIYKQIA